MQQYKIQTNEHSGTAEPKERPPSDKYPVFIQSSYCRDERYEVEVAVVTYSDILVLVHRARENYRSSRYIPRCYDS